MRNILRASVQVASSRMNSGRLPSTSGATSFTTRSAATYSPGNTRYGCHCGSASNSSKRGSTSVRDQPKAKVSATVSAISQPVLVGFSASMSCMTRHMPARASTRGRQAHMQ